MWFILKSIFTFVFWPNIGTKKGDRMNDDYPKSKPLASLLQSLGPVYDDDLAYDEDSQLHYLEPTQHSWVLDPS